MGRDDAVHVQNDDVPHTLKKRKLFFFLFFSFVRSVLIRKMEPEGWGCPFGLPGGIVESLHWSATSRPRCRQFRRLARAAAAGRQHSAPWPCATGNNIRNNSTLTLPVASSAVLCARWGTLWPEPEAEAPGKGNSGGRSSRSPWNTQVTRWLLICARSISWIDPAWVEMKLVTIS